MTVKGFEGETGATLVEAAISFPVFIFVLLCGLELLRFSMIMLADEMAVIEGVRHVITGECGSTVCSPALRAQYAQGLIVQRAAGYGVQIKQNQICVRPVYVTACTAGVAQTAGNPGDFLVADVTVPFTLLIGLRLPMTVRASAIGRNEPFPE